ncbi:E3 ubiquitin-protein ligase TRIM50-like [Acipenser oxyrinchus oxyrinchus]|uniref:E3 ubiquitin-protein ligase TRIM50-like n=1 Tax=Acipenser oxyrinchus oxyrinchus TaxID=40147 RepID=A0AAD8D4U3_ACIOX|nr:E3 ubiquitin-protein ligase TRIM50-like [Acipenser oxyrinchus oxyrinchus]
MAEEEEDDLNCPACQRLYHVPLLLPCSHSLCRSCVLRVAADSQKPPRRRALAPLSCTLDCPRCLFSVELPSPDWASAVEYLPVNPALQDAVDRHVGQAECRDHAAESPESIPLFSLISHSISLTAASPREPHQGSVELSEEDMERFLQGRVSFKLDPHSAHPCVRVSPTGLTVRYLEQGSLELGCSSHGHQVGADAACSSLLPCVLADISMDWGLCYWEVDVCNSRFYRIGRLLLGSIKF